MDFRSPPGEDDVSSTSTRECLDSLLADETMSVSSLSVGLEQGLNEAKSSEDQLNEHGRPPRRQRGKLENTSPTLLRRSKRKPKAVEINSSSDCLEYEYEFPRIITFLKFAIKHGAYEINFRPRKTVVDVNDAFALIYKTDRGDQELQDPKNWSSEFFGAIMLCKTGLGPAFLEKVNKDITQRLRLKIERFSLREVRKGVIKGYLGIKQIPTERVNSSESKAKAMSSSEIASCSSYRTEIFANHENTTPGDSSVSEDCRRPQPSAPSSKDNQAGAKKSFEMARPASKINCGKNTPPALVEEDGFPDSATLSQIYEDSTGQEASKPGQHINQSSPILASTSRTMRCAKRQASSSTVLEQNSKKQRAKNIQNQEDIKLPGKTKIVPTVINDHSRQKFESSWDALNQKKEVLKEKEKDLSEMEVCFQNLEKAIKNDESQIQQKEKELNEMKVDLEKKREKKLDLDTRYTREKEHHRNEKEKIRQKELTLDRLQKLMNDVSTLFDKINPN
mmetsp:Transcript_4120/g.8910  ORF Transcript_4120/g.8910 Transcript_4120/m.8910 type:complete len:506 (-) Transcript_4120:132-1649(-)